VEPGSIVISVAIAAASGISASALFIWRVSASWTKFETETKEHIKGLEKKNEDLKKDQDNIKKDLDDQVKETQDAFDEQGRQWQTMNRVVGHLEGALDTMQQNPVPNPRRSRPG
jgi:hypothetical protein